MNTVFHEASSRGKADHGWLVSHHTFSFANYHDPERIHFGALRVLNDDHVAAGRGFGKHPHENMEIISIPLSGDLRHEDSMGNETVIREGDVQAMSAGTGVTHGEMNASANEPVDFLQIWVFPKLKDIAPTYSQITLDPAALDGKLEQIVSPTPEESGVTINQDAWFHLGHLPAGAQLDYAIHRKGNGVYAFLLKGEATIAGRPLKRRDGLGVWDTETVSISATSPIQLLLMDVPMLK